MNNFLNVFFFLIWFIQFLKKKSDKSNFLWLALLIKQVFLIFKFQPNVHEQKKKQQRINDLLNAVSKPMFCCLLYTKQRKKFKEKEFF